MLIIARLAALGLCLMVIGAWASADAAGPAWIWPQLPPGSTSPPLPANASMTAAKVELGRRLFYDADLSRDGTLACAGCHEQKHGFADGNRTHPGVTGEPGIRNVPGLANVAWRTPLTWADPNQHTLEQQAMVPLTGDHPVEMGMAGQEAELVRRLSANDCYRQMFAAAFPRDNGRIDFANAVSALAAFQRTLISADSPYDRFRAGKPAELSPSAQKGANQFKVECSDCHSGADLTDNRYHYVGTATDPSSLYSSNRKSEEAVAQFRTPPLRNVAVTGPWLHDGSAPTIEDAIRRHAAPSLARIDMPAMLAFMSALTDERFLRDERFALPRTACGRAL